MARIINTAEVDLEALEPTDQYHAYCGMDSAVTREVLDQILPQFDEVTSRTYDAARTLQAPVFHMNMKGCLIDARTQRELLDGASKERDQCARQLKVLIDSYLSASIEFGFLGADWTHRFDTFNYRSDQQVKDLFYGLLAMPEILGYSGKPTVDRHALERLVRYPLATPYARLMMDLRDTDKSVQTLNSPISADGRYRTTHNIVGTTTGRFSAYKSFDGTGGNAQNVAPGLRSRFVADPGCKLAYIDLEQAEARSVGARIWNLFGDSKYLDAVESGDVHTAVAKMVWPHIKNREDAEQLFYREFSHRFICKRVAFGSNLIGTPRTIAQETSIPAAVVDDFQHKYFTAFPGIRAWHHWAAQQLVNPGYIVSLMGRKRWFMGRKDDDAVIREAVGFDAQEPVAKILNMGLFATFWASHLGGGPEKFPLDILFQIHDAVLIQYPEHLESELLPQILPLFRIPLTLRSARSFVIPSEAKVGWNWGEYDADSNRDGIVKWTEGRHDTRNRTRQPSTSLLD